MFPELVPLFEARFDEVEEGEEAALPSFYRARKGRATTMLETAIKRAGVTHCPRLWHSLRATRQSELAEIYPAHIVSAWIGNAIDVAEKHYLMVTDEHFARATQNATQDSPASRDNQQQATEQGRG